MAPITPRLDLNKPIVDKAKRAKALRDQITIEKDEDLEKIHFSDTLTLASNTYLADVLDLLDRAGFRKRERLKPSEKRPRRVDAKKWEELKEAAEQRGVSRMDLVRALLTLLGEEHVPHMGEHVSETGVAPDQSTPATPPGTDVA